MGQLINSLYGYNDDVAMAKLYHQLLSKLTPCDNALFLPSRNQVTIKLIYTSKTVDIKEIITCAPLPIENVSIIEHGIYKGFTLDLTLNTSAQ